MSIFLFFFLKIERKMWIETSKMNVREFIATILLSSVNSINFGFQFICMANFFLIW